MKEILFKIYRSSFNNNVKLIVAIIAMCIGLCSCVNYDDNEYLVELDNAINQNPRYVAQKEHLINELKNRFVNAKSDKEAYDLAIDIYQNYQYFSLDSSFIYLNKAKDLSITIGEKDCILNTKLSLAFLYNFSGMLSEASEIFRDIEVEDLSPELKRNLPIFLL